jgi:Domain of unknown function (DUF3883)
MLYFEDQNILIKGLLESWLGKNNTEGNDNQTQKKLKRIAFGNQTILYDDFNDLKIQLDSILDNKGLKNITSSNIKISKNEITIKDNNESGSHSKKPKKPKVPKEEIGFLGEYIAYRFLLETIDAKESVKWVSEYASACSINMDGKDGLGYDMEYIPNGAKHPRYVEVKVVGWEDAFHITSTEVKYGEKYKKHYEIFLVRNIETPTKSKIEKIQGLFDYKGKSFTDNDLFSVINDKFIIKFKKVE